MGRLTKWTDVRASLSLEITPDLMDELSGDTLRALLPFVDDPPYNLIIEFSASGSYDPGSTYDPDTAYPPETSEDRELVQAYVEGGKRFSLPVEVQQALFARFEEEIYNEPLPPNDPF